MFKLTIIVSHILSLDLFTIKQEKEDLQLKPRGELHVYMCVIVKVGGVIGVAL